MTTLLDVIYDIRLRADDMGGDTGLPSPGFSYYWEQDDAGCLFKNAELVRYLNSAHREIAVRTRCYRDTNSELCQIAVSPNKAVYDYDPRILSTEEVLLGSSEIALEKLQLRDLRAFLSRNVMPGVPRYYAEEDGPFRLTLAPTPATTDTLYLTVYRLPLEEWGWAKRKAALDEPPESLRQALVHGALMYAYQKRDADTSDLTRYAFHTKEFETLVGPSVSYRTLEDRRWNANLDMTITPSPYTPRRRRGRFADF